MRKQRALLATLAALVVAAPVLGQPKPAPKPPVKPAPAAMPTKGPLGPAIDALKAGDYAAAEKALASLKTAEALAMLARVQIDQGKYAEAEKTLASLPSRADAIPLRARILRQTGKLADAVKLLEGAKNEKGRAGQWIRLLLGESLIDSGRRADAEAPLMTLIDDVNNDVIKDSDAEGNALAGRAAHLLRAFKNAVTLFLNAVGVDKEHYLARLWMAELYLEKYDPGDAEDNLRQAAKAQPKNPDLLVGMARLRLQEMLDFDAAEKLAAEALKINPKHAGAFAVRAGLALRDMDLAAADKAIADGLAVDPNDLELRSLIAASRFLADDPAGFAAAKKDVLSRNGEYSRMYSIVAEYAEWEHRYDDIVTMMQEALKVDAKDVKAQAQLGLMQMRAGDEQAGLANLQGVFNRDKYNMRVYNTLLLYEKNIATDYDLVVDGPFKVRLPKRTKPVLERYVPRLLAQAWASMKSRYGFVPQNPVQVELYEDATTQQRGFIKPAREQFGVRTAGLPHIGIQGVCFGKVLAAMGPSSPQGERFNWGNVLWHELGHVFAIQLSKNHVPRWFTEGLSEYETLAQRPEWRRTLDPKLYRALLDGKLPAAVDMNRAFTHVDDPNDVLVAYYAASQMMVWTVETFGMPKVVEALKLWGQGVRTPEVLKRAFGVEPKDYDARFRAWATARLERYKGQFMFAPKALAVDEAKAALAKAPNDPTAHTDLAWAHLGAGDRDAATKEIEAALKLAPDHQTAHWLYARIAVQDKDRDSAQTHLEAIKKAGGDGYQVEMMLANLAELRKDKAASRAAFEDAWKYDPTQPEPLQGLYDLAKEDKRDADALEALRKLAPIDQHDAKVWRLLLGGLVDAGQWADAAKVGESAVLLDVGSAAVHAAYARALAETGDAPRAAFEAESATLCPDVAPKEAASAHATWAKVLLAQKKLAEARAHRDEALKLDPDSPGAKALHIP